MDDATMTPLERGLLRQMQIRGAVAGMALLVAAAIGERLLRETLPLAPGSLILPAFLLLAYLALWAPSRRYRAWGYRMDEEELQVRRGVWVQVHTVVPLGHVQHIDVSQGPLERAVGICSLVLHTAGTLHSQIVVPGLARATAEHIRDEIRGRIREQPA